LTDSRVHPCRSPRTLVCRLLARRLVAMVQMHLHAQRSSRRVSGQIRRPLLVPLCRRRRMYRLGGSPFPYVRSNPVSGHAGKQWKLLQCCEPYPILVGGAAACILVSKCDRTGTLAALCICLCMSYPNAAVDALSVRRLISLCFLICSDRPRWRGFRRPDRGSCSASRGAWRHRPRAGFDTGCGRHIWWSWPQ